MAPVLSNNSMARIQAMLKKNQKRIDRLSRASSAQVTQMRKQQIESRRRILAERRRNRQLLARRLNRGLSGLKILMSLAQSEEIQELFRLEEELGRAPLVFYRAVSSRKDAPDIIEIHITSTGIEIHDGCLESNDFELAGAFPFAASDEELRETLSRFLSMKADDAAFNALDPAKPVAHEWAWPASMLGFQVFVDCNDPERFERYVDVALRHFESVQRSKAA